MDADEERQHERHSLRFSIAQVRAELGRAESVGEDIAGIRKALSWLEQSLRDLK